MSLNQQRRLEPGGRNQQKKEVGKYWLCSVNQGVCSVRNTKNTQLNIEFDQNVQDSSSLLLVFDANMVVFQQCGIFLFNDFFFTLVWVKRAVLYLHFLMSFLHTTFTECELLCLGGSMKHPKMKSKE